VTFILEQEERKATAIIKLNLFFSINIFTPHNYLKKPDHAGSLTKPILAGNLNLAPLKVTPANMLIPSSLIA
jgi:hypothetical protein